MAVTGKSSSAADGGDGRKRRLVAVAEDGVAMTWWRVLWRDSAVGINVRSWCWRTVCHGRRQRLEWTAGGGGKQRRPVASSGGRRFGQQGGGELRSGGKTLLVNLQGSYR
ncbi:hypothetical protein Salat_1677000 [Sesamum alatum]|uniref:Uncharacterized protein n=1 Tax=Sesamum alatum TaxID=300844 RepID=A0AAE2CK29_9LAMI|nr:hypothetical protein Salat_1677000 [Sesamum alatum]